MTVGINTEAINHKNIPFTMYDLGWVVLCIGAAIGSGIVFFPLQVGLKGVWVFARPLSLGYPAVYYMQKLFIETMARSDEQDSYLSIITSYVGSRWGVLLGALYSFTMLKSMVEYALAITNDSASYLKTFGLTNQTLSEHWWWSLLLIAGLSGRVERRKAALQSFRQHDRRKAGDHRSDWFRGDPFLGCEQYWCIPNR